VGWVDEVEAGTAGLGALMEGFEAVQEVLDPDSDREQHCAIVVRETLF